MLNSLGDSIHGGSGHEDMTPLEQQYQLFASFGAIKFPIDPVTEAWKEKVRRWLIYKMSIDNCSWPLYVTDVKQSLSY